MRPYEPHRFEEETSVNLIPGLGPIHLPSNEICRHCGHFKDHSLHRPTWVLVDQLADALEKTLCRAEDEEDYGIREQGNAALVAAGRISE